MLKNGLNEHFLKKLLKRKVHLVVRKENETEGSVTATANDNLKTITHIKRQDNPRYILQRNKEDPPVTKKSGGSLVTDLVRQFEGWAPSASNERLYRFGDNPVEESPHKRQRRHTPVISPSVRTPTRRSSRPGRTSTRWTGSPSLSRRKCSETLATQSTLSVSGTRTGVGGEVAPVGGQIPGQSCQTPAVGGGGHRGGHRHHRLPLEGPVKEKIREINMKEKLKQEEQIIKEIETKKMEENVEFIEEISKENTERKRKESNEESKKFEEERKEENQAQFRDSYLSIPGPGARASQGCLENPGRKQKFGEKSSLSQASSGAMRNFTGVHGSSGEGELSGPKFASTDTILTANRYWGTDACSCSTAATHCGTVLAGNIILNCTLGGKTTGGRNWQYGKDNDSLSLNGQLGRLSGPNHTSHGNYQHQTSSNKIPRGRNTRHSCA